MPRKRPTVPQIPEITRKSNAYDTFVLGKATEEEGHQDLAAKAAAFANLDYDTAIALQNAIEGEDSDLFTYSPTRSINPPRPRTNEAGWDPKSQTLFVRFREGAIYGYYGVPENVWRNFRRVQSPGRAINRTLNFYPYSRLDHG